VPPLPLPSLRGLAIGSTVLVVGLGAIGESVARLCDAFGATVLATRRSPGGRCAQAKTIRQSTEPDIKRASILSANLSRQLDDDGVVRYMVCMLVTRLHM
jgi:phosphoglycerate dehydrogenase-like enzyme